MANMEHIIAGDQVVAGTQLNDRLTTVERVTQAHIITKDGQIYRRSDGITVSRSQYETTYIRDATGEDRSRLAYRDATHRAEAVLETRSLSGLQRQQIQTYKARLLDAKAIIDAALDAGEATA